MNIFDGYFLRQVSKVRENTKNWLKRLRVSWHQPILQGSGPGSHLIAGILGHPTLRPGISGIVPVPNNDQSLSNYRYFCDNDHLHPSGSSRWSIRNDPVPLPPKPYIPQKERPGPFWDYIPPDADQLQDLVDIRNGVGMSAPWGCHAKHVKAATASAKLPGPYRQPIRATTTVCYESIYLNVVNVRFASRCAIRS